MSEQPSRDDENDDELRDFFAWVHEQNDELEEAVAAVPPQKELDEQSVEVGKYRAIQKVQDELLKRLDPETYEALHGVDSDE